MLGKPPFKTKDELDSNYSIKPNDGSLVLFPSDIWRATQPYQGKGNRLIVAFDVGEPDLFFSLTVVKPNNLKPYLKRSILFQWIRP